MVHISDTHLHITLEHPFPKELLKELQESIVRVLQAQYMNTLDVSEELNFANYTLSELMLELLKGEGFTVKVVGERFEI
jgi:hypothetical protein